jgi:hypothetical protein
MWCGLTTEIASPFLPPPFDNVFWLFSFTMSIPVITGFPDVVSRKLYRTCRFTRGGGTDEHYYNGNFLFVKEFQGNEAVSFEDDESENEFLTRMAESDSNKYVLTPDSLAQTNIFIRYNDSLGAWDEPIYKSGDEVPIGRIFKPLSPLKFQNISEDSVHTASEEEMYHFFGADESYNKDLNNWKDLMMTKRKVTLSMNTNEINPGDAFRLKQITKLSNIGRLVVKKTNDELMSEISQVELITL